MICAPCLRSFLRSRRIWLIFRLFTSSLSLPRFSGKTPGEKISGGVGEWSPAVLQRLHVRLQVFWGFGIRFRKDRIGEFEANHHAFFIRSDTPYEGIENRWFQFFFRDIYKIGYSAGSEKIFRRHITSVIKNSLPSGLWFIRLMRSSCNNAVGNSDRDPPFHLKMRI